MITKIVLQKIHEGIIYTVDWNKIFLMIQEKMNYFRTTHKQMKIKKIANYIKNKDKNNTYFSIIKALMISVLLGNTD